jgi:Ca-activated chloride channel family protein
LLQAAPSHQEQYTFQVEVKTVYVDVFITRDGNPVTGLTRENFEIFDNGVRQEIDLLDTDTVPMSALLVLDISSSVRGQRLAHLRAAAHAFVDGLDVPDEAGLLTFSHQMRLIKSLDNNFDGLHVALDQPLGGGSTALNDALFVGLKLLEAANGRPLLLLFTDGLDMASWLGESEVLEVAKASQAIIYAVGVRSTEGVYMGARLMHGPSLKAGRLLERLTETTGGQVWFADSTASLKDIYLGILAEMETRYLLSYQPQGVLEEGWHKIEVKLKNCKADEVRARTGYTVSPGQQ